MAAVDNIDNVVNNKSICLMLMVGLPGSGKTFLTNFLVNRFHGDDVKLDIPDVFVVPITYDDYIIYDNELVGIEDWKQKRKTVFSSVEDFILYYKGVKPTLNDNLYNINNNPFSNYSQYIEKNNLFIIIDDNMYYKSMRFEYFKLAKKYNVSFCQIYLEATLEDVLKYNKRRVNVVPDNVINKMHKKIEKPNSFNNWERNSLVVPAFVKFDDKLILCKLHDVIKSALCSPEKCEIFNESFQLNRENCKKITDTNLIHQIDIQLRGIINTRIKDLKRKDLFNKNELKYNAEQLNNQRIEIIKNLKSGVLKLPSELVNVLQCNKSISGCEIINSYLLNMFVLDIV